MLLKIYKFKRVTGLDDELNLQQINSMFYIENPNKDTKIVLSCSVEKVQNKKTFLVHYKII